MTIEQVINDDVLLGAQPTEQFGTVDQVRHSPSSCAWTRLAK